MARVFSAEKSGKGIKIAIAVSRFNTPITQKLLESAKKCLTSHRVSGEDVDVTWVPGAFELPQTVQALAETGRYDGILPLGCIIRGETPHFEHICHAVASGLAQVALETHVPVVFGVLTTNDSEQAWARAGGKSNKGIEAAEALLELIGVIRHIRSS